MERGSSSTGTRGASSTNLRQTTRPRPKLWRWQKASSQRNARTSEDRNARSFWHPDVRLWLLNRQPLDDAITASSDLSALEPVGDILESLVRRGDGVRHVRDDDAFDVRRAGGLQLVDVGLLVRAHLRIVLSTKQEQHPGVVVDVVLPARVDPVLPPRRGEARVVPNARPLQRV